MVFLSMVLIAVLASVHLFAGRLRFLDVTPRSRWLSAAGGISVAYVFIHILPDLAEEQETLREVAGESLAFIEYHIYLISLVGLAVFYGLERAAKASRRRHVRIAVVGEGQLEGRCEAFVEARLWPVDVEAPDGGVGRRGSSRWPPGRSR